MCGIVGGRVKTIQQSTIDGMVHAVAYRGPDGHGSWYQKESGIFLGHARLSIIDLSSAGEQPMSRNKKQTEKKIHITYNGELYNYKEIQKELIEKGYVFTSASDTEVLLHAYAEWGIHCVKRCIGMFAFALYDEETDMLYLCRDRFGVKPLYYTQIGLDILFASDIRAFMSHEGYTKQISKEALAVYFQFGYIPSPQTIFEGTYKLEPGHVLIVDRNGHIEKKQYWSPSAQFVGTHIDDNEETVLAHLETLLEKSFSYRMIADVPVGIFLSGGIDSSLIAALLQKKQIQKIKTFSIGFDEECYDEAPQAKKVAQSLGTEHFELYVSSLDARKHMHTYVQTFSEPFGDTSGLPTFLLSQFAREQVTVVLSGDGGDELFAGYTKYIALDRLSHTASWKRYLVKKFLDFCGIENSTNMVKFFGRIRVMPAYTNLQEKISKLHAVLSSSLQTERFVLASTYWQPKEFPLLFSHSLQPVSKNIKDVFKQTVSNTREQMQLWDLEMYLPDDILVKTDRTTMAVGLEGREPFLDESLLAYTATISPKIKYNSFGEKVLLKKILRKYLPEACMPTQKKGFRLPMSAWLRSDWKEELNKYFDSDMLEKQGLFNSSYIISLWKDFQKGTYVNPDKLWLFIAFQYWWESFMEERVEE